MVVVIDPATLSEGEAYKYIIGAVLPRPIAWVSTMDGEGRLNLAPFSYFTGVCPKPLTLLFCPGVHPNGAKKDTWLNIEQTGEFVINMTNEETAVAMNRSATILPRGESEFAWAGVTPLPSEKVRVPRVAESPIAFECKLQQIVVVSEQVGGGAAIFGEVVWIHVRDEVWENGRIALDRYRPIGRLAGNGYTRVNDLFELKRLPPPEAL